jgi:peptidoglycan/LPS O-acetylase OafA/YrhL
MLMWLLRGLAGLAVAAGHLRARVYPGFGSVADPTLAFEVFAFLTGFAHLAIVVFFVLSGWLAGGGLLDRFGSPGAMRLYAIGRVIRLWIVLVPAYAAMLLFAACVGWLDASSPDLGASGDYSAGAFIGNLLGLQTLAVPRFGGNYPLWTLANGTWYYLLFPLLLACLPGAHGLGPPCRLRSRRSASRHCWARSCCCISWSGCWARRSRA